MRGRRVGQERQAPESEPEHVEGSAPAPAPTAPRFVPMGTLARLIAMRRHPATEQTVRTIR